MISSALREYTYFESIGLKSYSLQQFDYHQFKDLCFIVRHTRKSFFEEFLSPLSSSHVQNQGEHHSQVKYSMSKPKLSFKSFLLPDKTIEIFS